mmetsp:Transcript_29400/g.64633  ORF Transcript_29400/g.64633 Transcript_29400/m.64633 type:complete len:114 (+) Transcript_29400:397-738(+)
MLGSLGRCTGPRTALRGRTGAVGGRLTAARELAEVGRLASGRLTGVEAGAAPEGAATGWTSWPPKAAEASSLWSRSSRPSGGWLTPLSPPSLRAAIGMAQGAGQPPGQPHQPT